MAVGELMKCNWKSKKAIGFYVFAFLVFLVGVPKPLFYSIEGVSGYVFDEETQNPIEGVAIEIWWSGKASGYEGWHSAGSWGGQYARSDTNGYFSVPGFRVRWRDWFSSRIMNDNEPRVRFIKSGYVPEFRSIPILAGRSYRGGSSSLDRELVWLVGTRIEGFQNAKAWLKSLPKNNDIERYKVFHHTFSLALGSKEACDDEQFRESGYLAEVFKEQKKALQAGLKTRIPASLQSKMLSDDLSVSDIEHIACTLLLGNLSLIYPYKGKS